MATCIVSLTGEVTEVVIGGTVFTGTPVTSLAEAKAGGYGSIIIADNVDLHAQGKTDLSNVTLLGGSNAVLSGNVTQADGAVIQAGGSSLLSGVTFSDNRNGRTYGDGGALLASGNLTVSDVVFDYNRAKVHGGAAKITGTNSRAVFSGVRFINNESGSAGGALYVSGTASATVDGCCFADNLNGAVTVDSASSTATVISGSTFATTKDAIHNSGNLRFSGKNIINATIVNSGTLTFADGAEVMFTGSATADLGGLDLSDVTVSVSRGVLDNSAFTIYSDVLLADDQQITVGDTKYTVNGKPFYSGTYKYAFRYENSALSFTKTAVTIGIVSNSGEVDFVVLDGSTCTGTPYTTLAAAYGAGSTDIIINNGEMLNALGQTVLNVGPVNIIGGTGTVISGNVTSGAGAIHNTAVTLLSGMTFFTNRNSKTSGGGGAVVNSGTITIDNVTFDSNTAKGNGFAVQVTGSKGSAVIRNSRFIHNYSNSATVNVGALQITSTATATIANCCFADNTHGALSIDSAAALAAVISGSTFADACDTVYNAGTIRVTGTNYFNASITGAGTINVNDSTMIFGNTAAIDVAALTLSGSNAVTINGAVVNFTSLDLSDVAITVNGDLYAGSPVTVATGVTAIGNDWTVTGASGDSRVLVLDSGNLVLTSGAHVPTDEPVETFVGSTLNFMTGGTITKAFFGMENPTDGTSIVTTVTGGTVGNALIAGAKVTKGHTASLGAVTLNLSGDACIKGGTANGGMLYTAGYAYGKNSTPTGTDSEVTLSVTTATLNLADGFAPVENLYTGAHARQGALTQVTSTAINVTGGTYGRVYGGGWGENYGRSEVSGSTIAVSGGTLGYIYAGGGNSKNGESVVTGNVTISVSGSAQVGIVFLAGKNQNCSITGNVTMTVSGPDKTMTRISGWNANGDKNTAGLTTLNVETNLSLQYLDNVKVIRIAEGKTMDVSIHLWHEAAAALTIDFDLATDNVLSNTDWIAMSGDGMEVYQAAQYTIDNGAVCRWNSANNHLIYEASQEDSGYALEFFTEENVDKVRFFKA